MLLLDVNLLVHAVNASYEEHVRAKDWVEDAFANERIALSWHELVGFVRLSTNPKVNRWPLTIEVAFRNVTTWLNAPLTVVIEPGLQHRRYFYEACAAVNAKGNLVTDAYLVALAWEHDCGIVSTDSDFGKFPGLRWRNPLAV